MSTTGRSKIVIGLTTTICLAICSAAATQDSPIDPALAKQYFQEARTRSDADGGRLWSVRLYGPILFVDRVTRTVVANQPDADGKLKQQGKLWLGTLDKDTGIANTATHWAGTHWTMVIWPLVYDQNDRTRLMLHELFHRVQDDIGLPAASPMCNHLDSRDGRIWLRLEWRALAAALSARGAPRQTAIRDALLFRAFRHKLCADDAANERALELNEGLAEYTGVKLRGFSDARALQHAAARLRGEETGDAFVRSFAYVSGPAYGLLLDAGGANWRKGLKPGADLGRLLHKAADVDLPDPIESQARERAQAYNGREVVAAETKRQEDRKRRLAEYKKRFFESPVLIAPLTVGVRYGFNPNAIEAYDENSNVYHTCTIRDEWGLLTVTGSALLIRSGGRLSEARVPAPHKPQAEEISGDGWTLELKPGWKLAPASRTSDHTITRK